MLVSDDRRMALLAWLLAGALLAGFIVLGRPQQVLDFLSAGNAIDRRDLRFTSNASSSYALDVVVAVFAPFVCFYLFAQWKATRQRTFAIACAVLALSIVLFRAATFQKFPWAFFLLQMLIVHQLTRRLSMNLAWIVGAAAMIIVTLGVAASIAYPERDIPSIGNYLLYRVAFITNEGVYQTFYVYPDYLPHTGGYNIGLVQSLFGLVPRIPAYSVVAAFFGSPDSTYNSLFIADAWVDFGWPGVLLTSILVGAFVKFSDLFFFQFGKSPLCIAGLTASAWAVIQLLSTAAPTAFLSGGLALLPATIMVLRSRAQPR